MDISSRLSLSYYKEIGFLNQEHNVSLVQHVLSNHVYVKKTINVYNKAVYEYIKGNPLPNIPMIYELLEDQGQLIVIEEYISGNTLDEMLSSKSSFSAEQVRNILLKLCDILINLHNCSPAIIHRDIKPSNIMVRPNGDIVLIDLNAAKYQSSDKSEDTRLLGTKGYAAPEQYGFGTSNIQTDIYAFGMLANTLLKGEFSQSIIENSPFTTVIRKCTQLNPNDRYSNVKEIKRRLSDDSSLKYLHEWQKFLPPGFRLLKPLHMILSIPVYALIFWLCSTLEVKNTNHITLLMERILSLLIFMAIIFCTFNYCNVQSLFPPCRTKNRVLKPFAIVLLDFVVGITLFISIGLIIVAFLS